MKLSKRFGIIALIGAGLLALPSCKSTRGNDDFLEEAQVASTRNKPDFMRDLEHQDDSQLDSGSFAQSSAPKVTDDSVWDASSSSATASSTSRKSTSSSRSTSSSSRKSSTSKSTASKTTKRSTKSSSPSVYTVKKGDNLWVLAKRYKTTEAKIMKANKMRSNVIRPGQKIKIP